MADSDPFFRIWDPSGERLARHKEWLSRQAEREAATNPTPEPTTADRLLADRKSPVDRAKDALRSVCMDPADYTGLTLAIGREIVEAEEEILKGMAAIARVNLGRSVL